MRHFQITQHDLEESARTNGLDRLSSIRTAYLERNRGDFHFAAADLSPLAASLLSEFQPPAGTGTIRAGQD